MKRKATNTLKRSAGGITGVIEGNEYISKLKSLVELDGRYKLEALLFLHEALEHTVKTIGERRHVSGRELLEGVRRLALEKYGMMARVLFESWGITKTEDIGEIVFLLVDNGIWGKTELDSREDFQGIYDLKEAFEDPFTMDNAEEG